MLSALWRAEIDKIHLETFNFHEQETSIFEE